MRDSACSWFRSHFYQDSPSWTRLLFCCMSWTVFSSFSCFSFLASGVSICQLCSGVCCGDGLHGVPWVKTAGRRHHGHMSRSQYFPRCPVRYCAYTDPGQVRKTRNLQVGAMDIEEAPDQPSSRIGSHKSSKSQIVIYVSLLLRGCQGAHISLALSRPRVDEKEFWVFSSDAA